MLSGQKLGMMEIGMTPHTTHKPSTLTLGVTLGRARRVVRIALSDRILCDNGNVLLSVLSIMAATNHIKHLKCG